MEMKKNVNKLFTFDSYTQYTIIIICLSATNLTRNFQFTWSFQIIFSFLTCFNLAQTWPVMLNNVFFFVCDLNTVWALLWWCTMYVYDTHQSSEVKVKLNNILLCSVFMEANHIISARRIMFQQKNKLDTRNITCRCLAMP